MFIDATEYHRLYYRVRRQEVFDYLGGKCVECGSTEELQVDHINPELKSFDINSRLSARQPEVRDELDKCQLLCRTHHQEKTARENSGFTHGSVYAWMTKKCRCDVCKPAWRAWQDERNAKRRKPGGRGAYKPR